MLIIDKAILNIPDSKMVGLIAVCLNQIKKNNYIQQLFEYQASWWFQPAWKILLWSKWESSPIFGVKIENMFQPPPSKE